MYKSLLFFFGIASAVAGAFTTACGPTTYSDVGGAAMTGSSSSGVVPPSSDGAYVLTLTQDSPLTCKVEGHDSSVGVVDASMRDKVIVDGTGGTSVECVVSLSSSFNVHAKIDDQAISGNFFEISIPSITPGTSESAPAQGNITFSSPWTTGQPYVGQCSFYFTPATPETVATGRVWVTFTCPGLTSGQSTCPISIGYAIFENCLTQGS